LQAFRDTAHAFRRQPAQVVVEMHSIPSTVYLPMPMVALPFQRSPSPVVRSCSGSCMPSSTACVDLLVRHRRVLVAVVPSSSISYPTLVYPLPSWFHAPSPVLVHPPWKTSFQPQLSPMVAGFFPVSCLGKISLLTLPVFSLHSFRLLPPPSFLSAFPGVLHDVSCALVFPHGRPSMAHDTLHAFVRSCIFPASNVGRSFLDPCPSPVSPSECRSFPSLPRTRGPGGGSISSRSNPSLL